MEKQSPIKRLLGAQKLPVEGVLMNLGLGKPQLDDLARSRKLTQEILISTPATSFVLARTTQDGGAPLSSASNLVRTGRSSV
jgi:hypothetical protein